MCVDHFRPSSRENCPSQSERAQTEQHSAYRFAFFCPHVQQAKTSDLRWVLNANVLKFTVDKLSSPAITRCIFCSIPFAQSHQCSSKSLRLLHNSLENRALSLVKRKIFRLTMTQHYHLGTPRF